VNRTLKQLTWFSDLLKARKELYINLANSTGKDGTACNAAGSAAVKNARIKSMNSYSSRIYILTLSELMILQSSCGKTLVSVERCAPSGAA